MFKMSLVKVSVDMMWHYSFRLFEWVRLMQTRQQELRIIVDENLQSLRECSLLVPMCLSWTQCASTNSAGCRCDQLIAKQRGPKLMSLSVFHVSRAIPQGTPWNAKWRAESIPSSTLLTGLCGSLIQEAAREKCDPQRPCFPRVLFSRETSPSKNSTIAQELKAVQDVQGREFDVVSCSFHVFLPAFSSELTCWPWRRCASSSGWDHRPNFAAGWQLQSSLLYDRSAQCSLLPLGSKHLILLSYWLTILTWWRLLNHKVTGIDKKTHPIWKSIDSFRTLQSPSETLWDSRPFSPNPL